MSDKLRDALLAYEAHELWAAAQLMPGEGIEDGVSRITAILSRPIAEAGLLAASVSPGSGDVRATESQAWKVGSEYAPYHPSASHVRPDYRDGWNACYYAAIAATKGQQP